MTMPIGEPPALQRGPHANVAAPASSPSRGGRAIAGFDQVRASCGAGGAALRGRPVIEGEGTDAEHGRTNEV